MGNDGGSIPTRRELVKEAAKALTTTQVKEVQTEQQEYAWTHDPLTRKPLSAPVVSDSAGVLYNKDSVIEVLLAEESDNKKIEGEKIMEGRVKSLKDVVEVKFQIDDAKDADAASAGKQKWVCPITGRELGPGAKAVYLVPCGHAFAGSVVKEVSGEICLQCNEGYAANDVIPILPVLETDVARLSLRRKTLREKGLTHALKKAPGSKKKKNKNAEKEKEKAKESNGADASADSKTRDKESSSNSEEEKRKASKKEGSSRPVHNGNGNGIKNASTASLTKRVLEEQEQRNKRRKMDQNANVKSLFSNRTAAPSAGNSADYMTRGFSIGAKK